MPEGAPPIPAIKSNLEAKALVPVGKPKLESQAELTFTRKANPNRIEAIDVDTGKPVEAELLPDTDTRGNFSKAPRENKQPPRESPRPKSERQRPLEPEPEAPPQEKPRETRARRTIRRHEPVTKKNARTVLEDLAGRASAPPKETAAEPEPAQPEAQSKPPEPSSTPPQPEATQTTPPPQPEAAKDTSPERRAEINALLQEASQLLFDIKDARVALTALAQQAADTPLGREFADQVLAMVQNIDTSTLPAHQRQAFDALKQKMLGVRPLPQPETKPQDTPFYKFLASQPAREQTVPLMQALENGAPMENVVSAALRQPEFKAVGTQLAKTLFPDGVPQTAQDILKAAGIDETRANIRTMEGILHPKDKLTIKQLGRYLFVALMIMMLSSQLLTPLMSEGERSSGH